jgi:hypothetical protein
VHRSMSTGSWFCIFFIDERDSIKRDHREEWERCRKFEKEMIQVQIHHFYSNFKKEQNHKKYQICVKISEYMSNPNPLFMILIKYLLNHYMLFVVCPCSSWTKLNWSTVSLSGYNQNQSCLLFHLPLSSHFLLHSPNSNFTLFHSPLLHVLVFYVVEAPTFNTWQVTSISSCMMLLMLLESPPPMLE